MNLLLDTHAVIWYITKDRRLPNNLKQLIDDTDNACCVSIVSLWEMGIKYSLGKLDLNVDLRKIFVLIDESGLDLLPVTGIHILTNTTLDFHHRDPFDRLIIAQAKSEDFILVSKDEMFQNYKIKLLWEK